MYIYEYILLFNSLFFSGLLIFSGFLIKKMTPQQMEEIEKYELEMIEYNKILNFEFLYKEEYELLQETNLPKEEIEKLKDVKMSFEVPNNKLIMFFKDNVFYYYTEKGDIIYKYLNVACRKYVIDNKCKQLFKEGSIYNEEKKKEVSQKDYFIKKKVITQEKEEKDKIINKTIWLGTIQTMNEELHNKPRNVKPISFLEFSLRS